MKIQSLTGAWQFRQAGSATPGLAAEAGEVPSGEAGWLPARAPGGVHTDLLAAGLIPDPFAGDNEQRVAWVAEADWETGISRQLPVRLPVLPSRVNRCKK